MLVCTDYYVSGFTGSNEGANGLYTLSMEYVIKGKYTVTIPTFVHIMNDKTAVIIAVLSEVIIGLDSIILFQKINHDGFVTSLNNIFLNAVATSVSYTHLTLPTIYSV